MLYITGISFYLDEKSNLKDRIKRLFEWLNKKLDEVVVYSSLYSGYGKTTEIIYKVKDNDIKFVDQEIIKNESEKTKDKRFSKSKPNVKYQKNAENYKEDEIDKKIDNFKI